MGVQMRREELHRDDAAAEEVIVRSMKLDRLLLALCVLACAGCRTQSSGPANAAVSVDPVPWELRDDDNDLVRNPGDRCPASDPRQPIGPDGCPVPHLTSTWVEFDSGADTLTAATKARLDEYAQLLTTGAWRGTRFEIVGHADACGSAGANLDLSQRRARNVERYLLAQGVDAGFMVRTYGVGEDKPLDPQPKSDCASGYDRRVYLAIPR